MDVRIAEGIATKRATGDPAASDRLRHEAGLLERLRHPGVVELHELRDDGPDTPVELRTVAVTGPPVASLADGGPAAVARAVAAVATTLADLHELGVAHTRVTADHVLLDPARRPVLCGLAEAVDATPADRAAADDVAALGRLLAQLIGPDPQDPLTSLRARVPRTRPRHPGLRASLTRLVGESTSADWTARPTARAFADRLWAAVDEASARPSGSPRRSRARDTRLRWTRGPAVVIAAVVAVVLLASYAVAGTRPARAARPARPPQGAPAAPPTEAGAPVITIDGHRYAVAEVGDQVVVGKFDCAHASAAVLTKAGGLFVFDELARDGADVSARHLRDLDSAGQLAAVDQDGDGCDELVVRSRVGRAITVSPRGTA